MDLITLGKFCGEWNSFYFSFPFFFKIDLMVFEYKTI